ncbi:MAG: hypothetical protein QOF60_31 [Actinomycetota bacterium]|jgi:uncharacterized membrane-anchored protein YjiN (DUF445 family)|nr:hypothetical protein [Actinomycetota bacterium]
MKRRATGLLVAFAVAFVAVARLDQGATWVGYATAGLEGSLVGGLADWFAVTALFRHPLGLPIPHTAVIRERKDQFGATLGQFVQENFLSAAVVTERVRAAQLGRRLAEWLSRPESPGVVDVSSVAEWVADAVRTAVEEGRHQPAVTALLRGAQTVLDDHREELRERFGQESPWWLPGPVEHRVFDRLMDGARDLLGTIADDPDHPLRHDIDGRLLALASPAEVARLLHHLGERLAAEDELRAKVDEVAERAVRYVAEHHHAEITDLIASTVARWDGDETSDKLELLLGRDLQFIRINGTIVGGLAGLAIHGLATLL